MSKKKQPQSEKELATPKDSHSGGPSADKSVDWENIAKRAMADLENYKKQAEKDKFEMLNLMKAASLVKFMEVYDDLARMLNTIKNSKVDPKTTPKEVISCQQNVMEGTEQILNKFDQVLKSEGLETIEYKKGDEFNPEFAEAVSMEDNEVGEGKIIETTEVGLKYKDKVIKPAKVRVGK